MSLGKLPEILQLGESPLAQDFVHSDSYRVGQIQTACLRYHRQADASVEICLEQVFGQACGLLAKEKVCVVGIIHLGVDVGRFGGEKVVLAVVFLHEIGKIIIICNVEQVPVIEPCALELGIVYGKAHRAYQMKPRSRCGAGASDIACILRNLGLYHDDVKLGHIKSPV